MLDELKEAVYVANQDLVDKGVVIYTWGNVSGIDQERGLVVIKPSGVDYAHMTPADMVVVELETGRVVEGHWRPSSDTPTHLKLYRAFPEIGGVAHTHSVHAVSYAQAGIPIPALGTTHADYFYGDIPCSRALTREEVQTDYEANTGNVIVETMRNLQTSILSMPGIVVQNHGPFTWGKTPASAVYHAVVMEKIAEMALKTHLLNPQATLNEYVLDKHYQRKHGPNAYYGQR